MSALQKSLPPNWKIHREHLCDLLALHNRRDPRFLQAIERCVEQSLSHRYVHAQAFCTASGYGYELDVYALTPSGTRRVPPEAWHRAIDRDRFAQQLAAIPKQTHWDDACYLAQVVGNKGDDLLLSIDTPVLTSTQFPPEPLVTLPRYHCAFLDDPKILAQQPFFVSHYTGDMLHDHPVVTRAHSFFLRDLARFAGLDVLSAIINAASGLLVSTVRPVPEALKWLAAQANLRALHWAPPPPLQDPVAAAQTAIRFLTHRRIPKQRIRLTTDDQRHRQVLIYATDEPTRFSLVGPWGGTIRLLSRYLGMPVRILPDDEMPWF